MTPSIAPSRAGLGTLALVAVVVAVTTAPPATAVVIDSFTDPLPSHPLLPATGAPVLFLGSVCDGAACPPGTIVTSPQEFFTTVEQSGLPGILGPIRSTGLATWFEPNPGASGVLTFDGRLALTTQGGPPLTVKLKYGDDEHPLNLDLRADGSDRFEIEILAAPTTPFDALQVFVQLGQGSEGLFGAPGARFHTLLYGPGVLVIPFSELTGRFEEFDDDVDFLKFEFVVSTFAGNELLVGEIRTASAPTPAEASSWGRIKSTYRR